MSWCSSGCRSGSRQRVSQPCGSRRGARAASIRSRRCATNECAAQENVVTRFLEDLKHALRVFRTSPVFAVTAVAAIALGIGTTTAIFSVVNAVVLKPVPFPEPDRIVQLQILRDGSAFGTSVSPAKFMLWRDLRGEVFGDLTGFMTGVPLTINQADVPEVVSGGRVSEGFFRVFGAPIARGRGFTADEDLPGAAPVVVLSHAFWRDRLAADPDIVGKAVSLGGTELTIVGVVGE